MLKLFQYRCFASYCCEPITLLCDHSHHKGINLRNISAEEHLEAFKEQQCLWQSSLSHCL